MAVPAEFVVLDAPAPESAMPLPPSPPDDEPLDFAALEAEFSRPLNEAVGTLADLMRPAPPQPTSPPEAVSSPVPVIPPPPVSFEAVAPPPPVVSGEPDHEDADDDLWEEIERAVKIAHVANTPEAWHTVATTADVVSSLAQTMELLAEAKRILERLELATDEGRRTVERCEARAEQSQHAAAELRNVAVEAERAARDAAQQATEAEETAAEAVRAVPAARQAAEDSAALSAEARRKTRELETDVALAQQVNTSEAWTRVLAKARAIRAEIGSRQAG